MEPSALYELSQQAANNAYAPYSKTSVGAAILLESGQTVQGCNIENVAYGSTMCAERVAVFNTIANGHDMTTATHIAISGPEVIESFSPCGACLQVLSEFAPEIQVVFQWDDKLVVKTLQEMMAFSWKYAPQAE